MLQLLQVGRVLGGRPGECVGWADGPGLFGRWVCPCRAASPTPEPKGAKLVFVWVKVPSDRLALGCELSQWGCREQQGTASLLAPPLRAERPGASGEPAPLDQRERAGREHTPCAARGPRQHHRSLPSRETGGLPSDHAGGSSAGERRGPGRAWWYRD